MGVLIYGTRTPSDMPRVAIKPALFEKAQAMGYPFKYYQATIEKLQHFIMIKELEEERAKNVPKTNKYNLQLTEEQTRKSLNIEYCTFMEHVKNTIGYVHGADMLRTCIMRINLVPSFISSVTPDVANERVKSGYRIAQIEDKRKEIHNDYIEIIACMLSSVTCGDVARVILSY
jgi:hypothetical protein